MNATAHRQRGMSDDCATTIANTTSALKRVRQTEVRTERNRADNFFALLLRRNDDDALVGIFDTAAEHTIEDKRLHVGRRQDAAIHWHQVRGEAHAHRAAGQPRPRIEGVPMTGQDGGTLVLDTRDVEAFGGAHVPGALNIPLSGSFAVWAGKLLSEDQDIVLVGSPDDVTRARTNLARIGSLNELKERAVEGWNGFEGNTPHRPWIDRVKLKSRKTGAVLSRISAAIGLKTLSIAITGPVRENFTPMYTAATKASRPAMKPSAALPLATAIPMKTPTVSPRARSVRI